MTKGQPSPRTDCQRYKIETFCTFLGFSLQLNRLKHTCREQEHSPSLCLPVPPLGLSSRCFCWSFWFSWKKKILNLQPFSENSLSEELERNICPQQSGLQMTSEGESQQSVCQSVKGGGIEGGTNSRFFFSFLLTIKKKADLITVPPVVTSSH